MDTELDDIWTELVVAKGKRAKRREQDAALDSGHLRSWYAAQDWPEPTVETYNQLKRAYRHSCHAGCCRWSKYVKWADRRQSRHQARMSLAKGYQLYRRKNNWASEAGYKGT